MQLKWIDLNLDSDGKPLNVHHLIDEDTQRCYATVIDPPSGAVLHSIDFEFQDDNRSYVTLAAAKEYCETETILYDDFENSEFICDDCRESEEGGGAGGSGHRHRAN